jgi:hypothetical protein
MNMGRFFMQGLSSPGSFTRILGGSCERLVQREVGARNNPATVCPGIIVSATSGKDGFTVKRLIALLVLVAAIMTTVGCGSDTSGTTVKKASSPSGSGSTETSKKTTP